MRKVALINGFIYHIFTKSIAGYRIRRLKKSNSIQVDKKQALKIIQKYVRKLRQEGIPVDRVILYGSFAAGKGRRDSDIDVAIVPRGFGKDTVEEGIALFRIAGEVDARLEPIPISVESYERDTWIPLIYEIKAKGVELKIAS